MPVVAAQPRIKVASGVLLGLLLVLVACVAIYFQQPPAAANASVPPERFSSRRAMVHLQTIAQAPHPTGTSENHAVREYLVRELNAQGAEPQVQIATVVHPGEAHPYIAGTVENVVGRIRGTAGGKAIVLMAHYDSAPTTPGASDDGAAVAALLETARALRSGAPLRNDVIFLITDGEEVGLLGARAFVNEHPWAKDVALVFNFEARGSDGPSMMFQTSPENGWLIREFAKTSTYAFANSLSGEIYRRLPNDTDFSVTKQAGMPGLNFAYISGLPRYHTRTDNLENIDQRSLQHQGANALAVARHFGNMDFSQARGERDAVYFDLPGGFLVHYSGAWVLPLMVITVIAFIGVVILGYKRGLLRFGGIALGFTALVVSCVASYIITLLVWMLVPRLHRGYEFIPWGDPYNSALYRIGFVLLTIAIVSAIYSWCRRWTSGANLAVGGMFAWALLAVASAFLLPGGSYLLTWPLLFALAGTAVIFYFREQKPFRNSVVLAAYVIPAIALVGPMAYWMFVALGLKASSTVMILVALMLGLVMPHIELIAPAKRWVLPVTAFVLSVGFIGAGLVTAGFDRRHPQMNQVFYGLNADTGKAVWGSIDDVPDAWTSQFFPENFDRGPLTDFFPRTRLTFMQSEAPAASLEAPKAELLEDRREGEVRVLRLQISSPRKAPVISAYIDPSAGVVSASLNGKKIEENWDEAPWLLQYYGVPEAGAELTLRVKSSQPLKLRIHDRSYQLPNVSYQARPDNLMPMPSQYSDTTLVSKSYTF